MPILYEHGETKEKRSNKPWFFVIGFLILAASLIWLYLYLDSENSFSIDDSENRAITTTYDPGEVPTKLVDEPTYTIRVPEGWQESDRYLDNGRLFVEYRGAEGTQEHAQSISIFSNGLPSDASATRLLPITARDDGTLKINNISERCHTFTDNAQAVATPEPELARWNEVDFSCNFSTILNTIGTGVPGEGQLATVKGPETESTYFFRFSDQNTTTNFEVFKEILRSFQAK